MRVTPEERGFFVDFDGGPDSYVVQFPEGRIFCCQSSDVEPDLHFDPAKRRHNSSP